VTRTVRLQHPQGLTLSLSTLAAYVGATIGRYANRSDTGSAPLGR
jgi:galactose mutarotase-like enzyme